MQPDFRARLPPGDVHARAVGPHRVAREVLAEPAERGIAVPALVKTSRRDESQRDRARLDRLLAGIGARSGSRRASA